VLYIEAGMRDPIAYNVNKIKFNGFAKKTGA
jgi:hypothetical protein